MRYDEFRNLLQDALGNAGLLFRSGDRPVETIARGEIESVKIGWSRRIPHDALTAYIERLRAGSAA